MKSAYKGIGVIGLATGATVLAISLIGCSNDDNESSTTTEPSAVIEPSTGTGSSAVKAETSDVTLSAQAVATEAASSKSNMVGAIKNDTVVPPPPPGLFRHIPTGASAQQPQTMPQAPATPVSPKVPATPQNVKAPVEPVAPVVTNAPQAPAEPEKSAMGSNAPVVAPKSPQVNVEQAAFPMKAKAAEAAKHAAASMEMPTPSMPKLAVPEVSGAIAKPSAPVAVESPKLEAPVAPALTKPKMEKPVSANVGNQGGQRSMSMPATSMNMPAARMPTMRMPSPNMNMGNVPMAPNMGYAPRMYFVPMPMYQYGQPYAPVPYGYMGGAPTMKQSQSGQAQESQQPQGHQ